MEYYLDSADIKEIGETLRRGFARGLTTNPSLLCSHVDERAVNHLQKIVDLVERTDSTWPISVQVTTRIPDVMIRQAEEVYGTLSYKNLVIKIPCSWETLPVIHQLTQRGIVVNCTACASLNQALLAAAAGAKYVSMFYGKMTDSGIDAAEIVSVTARQLDGYDSKLIIGSLRRQYDIFEIARAGAHIVTVPYSYFEKIAWHEKTAEAIDRFAKDFLPLASE
jgi:transaldolase